MASDDDTVYVDVAARFDEASVDRAVNEIKGKFSHVGDSIKDSLSGALGSVARGYAHGTTALSRDHMNKALGELLA